MGSREADTAQDQHQSSNDLREKEGPNWCNLHLLGDVNQVGVQLCWLFKQAAVHGLSQRVFLSLPKIIKKLNLGLSACKAQIHPIPEQ